jgi:hypothetical protein
VLGFFLRREGRAARKFADKNIVKPLKANFTNHNRIFGSGEYNFLKII